MTLPFDLLFTLPEAPSNAVREMIRPFSIQLENDVLAAVQAAANCGSILDISLLAEQVRKRNEAENVALEDILHALLQQAQWLNLPVEFSGEYPSPMPALNSAARGNG